MSQILRQIVEAGAGCGKTYGLQWRYLNALEHLQPREILALTFTEDAALEMRTRILDELRKQGKEALAQRVLEEGQISTFHGFCLKALQNDLPRLGYSGPLLPVAVAEQGRREHVQRELARLGREDPARAARLLSHSQLHEITRLGAQLWFAPLGRARVEESLRELREMRARWEQLRAQTLAQLQSLDPELPVEWPRALAAALQDPLRCDPKTINFSRGKRLPELNALKERAQELREFLESDVLPCLSEEFLRREQRAQQELMDFLEECRASGPKLLDFAALEAEFRLLSKQSPWPPPKLLMVDEFQDTNEAQYEILRNLANDETEFYFVGDPKQSIYLFRGGDVSLFLRLRQQLDRLQLETNRRSEASLLGFMNCVQQRLFENAGAHSPPPQNLLAHKKDTLADGVPHVRLFELASKEAAWSPLVQAWRQRQQELPDARHAALFYSWKQLLRCAEYLQSRGLPYEITGSEDYLGHPLTEIFCATLELLDNPEHAAGRAALTRWAHSNDPAQWLLLTPPSGAELLGRANLKKSASWQQNLLAFCTWVGVSRFPKGSAWAAATERALSELQNSGMALQLGWADLAQFLRAHAARLNPELAPLAAAEGAAPLTLMTIHGSKGLQFDCVYLPELYEVARNLSNGGALLESGDEGESSSLSLRVRDAEGVERSSLYFRYRARLQRERLEAEKRRLFYVALTRAERTLDIFAHTPSEKSSRADAFAVLGWPRVEACAWHRVLRELADESDALKNLHDTGRLEFIAAEDRESATPSETSDWLLPPPQPAMATKAFFRGGVSAYVRRQEIHAARLESEKSESGPKRLLSPAAKARGEALHAVLERWNGEHETLEGLLPDSPSRAQLRSAVQELRKVPELQTLWQALAQHPEQFRRELRLYALSPDYRLFGKADMVWFPNATECVLLDWKSTSRLTQLSGAERLQKVRTQLAVYAEALAAQGQRRVRALAVGVEFKAQTARAAVVLDETFLGRES